MTTTEDSNRKQSQQQPQQENSKTRHLFRSRYSNPNEILSSNLPPSSQTIRSSVGKNIMTFIRNASDCMNNGDRGKYTKLIKACINDNVKVMLLMPCKSLELIGSDILIKFVSDIMNVYPDATMKTVSWKCYRDKNNVRIVKRHVFINGTIHNENDIPNYFYQTKQVIAGKKELDNANTGSSNDERMMTTTVETPKRYAIEYYNTIKMFVDDSTNKIGLYEVYSTVVAMTAIDE